jgi:hypothetical protein
MNKVNSLTIPDRGFFNGLIKQGGTAEEFRVQNLEFRIKRPCKIIKFLVVLQGLFCAFKGESMTKK